jgi:hypothetical protein
VTKTYLPTTMGLEKPLPGRSSFHLRFFVSDHSVGTFVSALTAEPSEPRKRSQSAAVAAPERRTASSNDQPIVRDRIVKLQG